MDTWTPPEETQEADRRQKIIDMVMETLVKRIKLKRVGITKDGMLEKRPKRWKVSQGSIHCGDGKQIPVVGS